MGFVEGQQREDTALPKEWITDRLGLWEGVHWSEWVHLGVGDSSSCIVL